MLTLVAMWYVKFSGKSIAGGFWQCSDIDEWQLQSLWEIHPADIPQRTRYIYAEFFFDFVFFFDALLLSFSHLRWPHLFLVVVGEVGEQSAWSNPQFLASYVLSFTHLAYRHIGRRRHGVSGCPIILRTSLWKHRNTEGHITNDTCTFQLYQVIFATLPKSLFIK